MIVAQEQAWEPVAEEVLGVIREKIAPVAREAADDIYERLLVTMQDHLADNAVFNLASRLDAAERARKSSAERARASSAQVYGLAMALTAARDFVSNYADVRDGDDGAPEPNAAMQLLSEIDSALARAGEAA